REGLHLEKCRVSPVVLSASSDCRQLGVPAANAGGTTWHCGTRFDSGLRRKPQWSNGRTTMMFSPRDRRRRPGQVTVGIKEGRMLGGTTYPVTINVSADLLCRPSKRPAG